MVHASRHRVALHRRARLKNARRAGQIVREFSSSYRTRNAIFTIQVPLRVARILFTDDNRRRYCSSFAPKPIEYRIVNTDEPCFGLLRASFSRMRSFLSLFYAAFGSSDLPFELTKFLACTDFELLQLCLQIGSTLVAYVDGLGRLSDQIERRRPVPRSSCRKSSLRRLMKQRFRLSGRRGLLLRSHCSFCFDTAYKPARRKRWGRTFVCLICHRGLPKITDH